MSWTNECTESNRFKVKNPKEVKAVLETLGFEVYQNERDVEILQFFGDEGTYLEEEDEVVLSLKPITKEGCNEPTNFIGCISDNILDSINIEDKELLESYNLTKEDLVITKITDYLQEELLEKEYIVLTSAGFEGRSSGNSNPFGDVTIITKNTIKGKSLYTITEELLAEINK